MQIHSILGRFSPRASSKCLPNMAVDGLAVIYYFQMGSDLPCNWKHFGRPTRNVFAGSPSLIQRHSSHLPDRWSNVRVLSQNLSYLAAGTTMVTWSIPPRPGGSKYACSCNYDLLLTQSLSLPPMYGYLDNLHKRSETPLQPTFSGELMARQTTSPIPICSL